MPRSPCAYSVRRAPLTRRQLGRAAGAYGAAEYLAAKFLTELPLDAAFAAGFGALLRRRVGLRLPSAALVGTLALTAACSASLGLAVGALSRSADAALALGLGLMIVYMTLGILNPAGVASQKPPSALVAAAARLSPIRWSIRALCVAELRGLELEKASLASAPRMGGLALVSSGDQVLERLGLEHESAARCARSLGALLAAQLVVGAGALALTRPRLAPVDEEDAR